MGCEATVDHHYTIHDTQILTLAIDRALKDLSFRNIHSLIRDLANPS